MKRRSDDPGEFDELREKIIGLGERSARKSYYPKLQEQLRELERTREQLRQLAREQRLILESAGEGIFGLDLDGNYTFMNRAAAAMLGYETGDLIGKHSHSCIHYMRPDGAPYPEAECRTYAAFRDGMTRRVDNECFCRKDGSQFPVEYMSTPIFEDGRITGAVVTFSDITERRKAEEEMKLARFSLDHASVSAFLVDRDARFLYVNEHACRALDYSREELLGMAVYDIDPNFPASIWPAHWNELKTGGALHFETVHRKKDGTQMPVQVSTNFIAFGGREYTWGFALDISERKRAENELKHAFMLTKTIIDSVNDAISLIDVRDYTIVAVNNAFLKNYGYPDASEIAGKHCYAITHRRTDVCSPPDDICPLIETVKTKEHFTADHVHYDREGREIYVEVSTSPIRDEAGNVVQVVHVQRDITERKRAEEALRVSESRFRNLFQQSSISMQILAPDGRTLEVNQAWEELWGLSPDALRGHNLLQDRQLRDKGIMPYILKGFGGEATEIPIVRYDPLETVRTGQPRWVKAFIYPVKGGEDQIREVVLMHWDVTDMVEAQEALQESENRFRAFFESAGVGTTQVDPVTQKFTRVNAEFCRMTGYSAEELSSMTFNDLTHPQDRTVDAGKFAKTLEPGAPVYETEKRYVRKDGKTIWVHVSASVVRDSRGKPLHTAGIVQDITDRKRMEDEIRHLAHHDTLTGLPNRRLFNDIVAVEIAQAERNRKKLALLFLDLDRFKDINDTLGHEAGDQLLREVASRLKSLLRRSDSIGRIGGDEFTIVLADIGRTEAVSDIARKIMESFRRPFLISGQELQVTASVGISICPDDAVSLDTLFRNSDAAMYRAKELGRNSFQFYDPSLTARSLERMQLQNMLRQSLERGEMTVYYQPQIDLSTGKMLCAEALLRWLHPERGLLLPEEFLSVAEESGFIARIDEWVLSTICRQLRSWNSAGLRPVCVTVNLSARQFRSPELFGKIESILKETGAQPESLDIEIPETTAMSDVEQSAALMRKLAGTGIHISLDDFGTGYSSLHHLKRMPVEKLKIDRSFIRDIARDPDDRAVINAVTAVAHTLRMKVIAEGVETGDQLALLKKSGCDEAQGFYFSEPLPVEKLEELMRA